MLRRISWVVVICVTISLVSGCGSDGGTTTTPKPAPSDTDTATDTPDDSSTDTPDDTTPTVTTVPDTPDSPSDPTPTTESNGEPFGDLIGRFVFDGGKPEAAKLNVTKDQEVCGKHNLVDESLVVGADNGIANIAVYLYPQRGTELPKPHPSYTETATKEVILDNLNCRFEPHICVITTAQKLLIGNKDPVGHNTKIDTQANPAINENLPAGASLSKAFSAEERQPAVVSCSVHPWMRGYLLVRESPYFAVTDDTGSFKIANLPTGEWTFQVWHEKARIQEVTVGGKKEKWSKGRVEFKVQGGENNLGDIKVAAAELE